ncbi:unnamed protein product [Dovyalis caffra]|uniref:Prostaglandin E synthase 2 n=1 Tax=Dovyalis caffra TaxID=77055 RepID=A0AAV1SDR9_9ROSI|nr:unnamed protein product [Dovyalis caffra]
MRRASTLASSVLSRTLTSTLHEGGGLSTTTAATINHRFLHAALYNTTSGTGSSNPRRISNPFSASLSVAGALVSAAAAASLSQEVLAKEPPPAELVPKEVVLYQYEACPFCNKVKAYLDYYDIPYKVVEVNPISKKEIKWSDYKKVPILMVDGEQLVDSSAIIDKLGNKIHGKEIVESACDEDDDEEKKWRSFTEKITVKYAGAAAMYFVSKNLKKKYNITDERAALYEAAETWVNALNGGEFLGGSKPNLADLAVFGVLRPIRYLRSGRDMVEHTRIGDWYTRMENAVGESSRMKA